MSSNALSYLAWIVAPVLAFTLATRVLRIGSSDGPRSADSGLPWFDTQSAFEAALRRHGRWTVMMALTGRRGNVHLPVLTSSRWLPRAPHTGPLLVPLCQIVGSVDTGRHPFDRRFDPSGKDAWARFSSVFTARSEGADLPPVVLARASDGYYVVDGHHRVAVARAYGDTDIAAEVTLLDG